MTDSMYVRIELLISQVLFDQYILYVSDLAQ